MKGYTNEKEKNEIHNAFIHFAKQGKAKTNDKCKASETFINKYGENEFFSCTCKGKSIYKVN